MKELVLLLCTLHGTVDSQNDGFMTLEVTPVTGAAEPMMIQVSSESFPAVGEGDEINLTALVDENYLQYCSNKL
jgi:hypothetical protein